MSLHHLTLLIAKTVYFDRPLPKDVSTARERNKLVYDVAFKSLCLDWSKRHAISSSSKQHASTPEWDYNNDENLQYNHWTFGDLNILIRNQSDGDVFNVKIPFHQNRRIYFVLNFTILGCRQKSQSSFKTGIPNNGGPRGIDDRC
jgi:hypothetical protein